MTKWINLPPDTGSDTEFTHHEVVTLPHICNHVFIVGASFIVHRPASIQNFKATLSYHISDLLFQLISLVAPPHSEEFHLNVAEAFLRIFDHLVNHFIEDELDGDSLDIIITTRVVLIDSLEPTDVVVGVVDHMHGQFFVSPLIIISGR
jgi:hypothetical protein